MIDANAIANLQMLMNTGDGRHAVLTELLQSERLLNSSAGNTIRTAKNYQGRSGAALKDGTGFEIRGSRGHRLCLLPFAPAPVHRPYQLTENIIQTLDRLSREDKQPLIDFAEGLAYHYNNLFMAVVGYISIIMFNLKPTHPSYDQLRECEELIHNTALLIRLLVDVFHRPQHAPETIYPIDLSDHEIGDRIFASLNKRPEPAAMVTNDLSVQKILKIVATVMGRRLKRICQVLQSQTKHIFKARNLRARHRDHRQQIEIHLNRGLSIADSLLDFATSTGIQKRSLDLQNIVREAIAIYRTCFSGLQISLECVSGSVPVKGHEQLLRKMLLELLANANDACPQGGHAHLKILGNCAQGNSDWAPASRSGQKARLIIEDSGPGLPECLGIRAFEPFTCGPGGRKRRGLGLAVVSGIVRAHGGHIRFYNRQQKGLVIRIELPLAASA